MVARKRQKYNVGHHSENKPQEGRWREEGGEEVLLVPQCQALPHQTPLWTSKVVLLKEVNSLWLKMLNYSEKIKRKPSH